MSKRNAVFSYLKIAGEMASSKEDPRSFLLGAVGIRKDGTIVKSMNAPSTQPMRCAHAEARLSRKLDYGAVVYVARVRLSNGSFGLAKPCHNCMKALSSKRVAKIYYTISDEEYGVLTPKY